MRATRFHASAAVATLITTLTFVAATAAGAYASPGLAPRYAGSATGIPQTVVESVGSPVWVFGLVAAIACVATVALSCVARQIRRHARVTFP